jgi:hypothetical protein
MFIARGAFFDAVGKLAKTLCLLALLRNALHQELVLDPQTACQILSAETTFHPLSVRGRADSNRRLVGGAGGAICGPITRNCLAMSSMHLDLMTCRKWPVEYRFDSLEEELDDRPAGEDGVELVSGRRAAHLIDEHLREHLDEIELVQ